MTIDHLNLKLMIFVGVLHGLRFDLKKFRFLEIVNFHPCIKPNNLFSKLLYPHENKDIKQGPQIRVCN